MAFDFNFDPEKMKQDSEDAQNKKAMLQIGGTIAQGFQTPSAFELLTGKKIDRPNVKGAFDSAAASIEDPSERQAKLYQAYKQAKDAEKVQNESADDAKLRDPNSVFSQYSRNRAKADGHSVDETMSANDVMKFYDAKKMDEIKANSAVDYQKQKSLHQLDQGAKAQEKQKDREFEAEQNRLKQNAGNKQFDNLPKDRQETILGLSKDNASKISITNQIDSVLKDWDKLPDDQKLSQGRQLLKTLNSTQGKDAVGAEEANRLGSKLEFALGNFTNSNSTQFGRDLGGFKDQADLTSSAIKNAIRENQKIIDVSYNGANGVSPMYGVTTPKVQEQKKSLSGDLIKTAQAGSAPGPRIVKKEFNQQLNKTRITLDDGSTQEIEGRQ